MLYSKYPIYFQNGNVFVFTGLIEFVNNEDQLAMVIGHEMAHALMLHAVSYILSPFLANLSTNPASTQYVPLSACQRNAISMVFCGQACGGTLFDVYWEMLK